MSNFEFDPWTDYWWPKVLRECEEYQATIRRRKQQHIELAIYVASFGAFALVICLSLVNGEWLDAMVLMWQQMTEPPAYSIVEVPYT